MSVVDDRGRERCHGTAVCVNCEAEWPLCSHSECTGYVNTVCEDCSFILTGTLTEAIVNQH